MASLIDGQRDFRSAQRDSKRFKDSSSKWVHGARPSAGCQLDWWSMEATGGSESQRAKMRPRGKYSESTHRKKQDQNVTKGRTCWDTPQRRVQAIVKARDEIEETALSRSLVGPPTPSAIRRLSISDGFTYSFDRTESPNRPQSLEVYVKPTTERDTERLVQREYEVLDAHGEALRGKKAQRDLRKGGSASDMLEDEGFELI